MIDREKTALLLDIGIEFHYNTLEIGVWRSLVSRLVRVQEASGSNPDTPTMGKSLWGLPIFRFFLKLRSRVQLLQYFSLILEEPLVLANCKGEE